MSHRLLLLGFRRLHVLTLVGCASLVIAYPASLRAAPVAKTCAAEPTATNLAYGDVFSTDCAVTPIADLDQFPLTAAAGDVLRLVGVDSGGSNLTAICLELIGPDPDLPRVTCANIAAVLEEPISVSGSYTVLVTESGNDQTIPYSLSVERVSPPRVAWPALPFGTVVQDDLIRSNINAYRLSATAGDFLRFILTDTGGSNLTAVCLEVIGPSGTTVVTPVCGNINVQKDLAALETGQYGVLVYESGYDQAIPYDLNVECLVGVCVPPLASFVGVYNAGAWRLDSNGNGAPDDPVFAFAAAAATRVVGDWDGDGRDEIGLFSNGFWYLDNDGNGAWEPGAGDKVFHFGWAGITPLVGDWNGDGRDTIGIYIDGFWYLDVDGDGIWDGPGFDIQAAFGFSGVTPFVGDWNGDGRDKIGFYINGFWYLDYNGNALWDGPGTDFQTEFGWAPVTPLVGDWNGDGRDTIGIFYNGFWFLDADGDGIWDGPGLDIQAQFGFTGVTPILSDWNGDGRDKIGIFINGIFYLDYDGSATWDGGVNDKAFVYGTAADTPTIGRW